MPHKHDAGQLSEGLDDVEIAQWADLEEGHAVLLRVGTRLLCRDLPLEGQVQPVPNQDPGDPGCMLGSAQDSAEARTWDAPSLCCPPGGALCRFSDEVGLLGAQDPTGRVP